MGVDPAQIAPDQHIGGLFGVGLRNAEMHKHLHGKIPQAIGWKNVR
jgi:hypothetical protein